MAKALVVVSIAIILLPNLQKQWKRFDGEGLLNPVLAEDPISQFERRLEPLRSVLPEETPVGYLSDSGRKGELYRSQYVLAPNLLIPMAGIVGVRMGPAGSVPPPGLVVGIYADPSNIARGRERFSLKEPRSFGNGVYLFEVDR